MKTILIFLLSAVCVSAQTIRVRQLWQDPRHEWHGTNGCPTNMPVAIGSINAPFVTMTTAEYSALTNSLWPTFYAWKTNQFAKLVADRAQAEQSSRQQNIQALLTLYDAFEAYEAFVQTNTPNNAQVLLQVRRMNGAFLRLKPLFKELYRGDD